MTYIAKDPSSFKGKVVGSGHCVPYVQAAALAPPTSSWKEGVKVKGALLTAGTAIASFQGGKYMNDTTGKSHAAIFVSQDANGIVVWDQWIGQPVHTRTIRFQATGATPVNNGNEYSVIE